MPRLTVNGIGLHYEERGTGPPLLLLMGYGTSATLWGDDYLDRLARSFRVIAPDNRGTGASEKRDEPVEIATFADDAVALLDTLGIATAHVFGVSMGGMIAQDLALRYPAKVRRLVLGCTHPGAGRMPYRRRRRWWRSSARRRGLPRARRWGAFTLP